MTVFYIIFAIFIFSFLIAIHEFGHFIAAKLFGVRVNEFAIGMGPAFFHKEIGETTYSLRCFPIGGFCAMEGEDEETGDPRAFTAAAWWKRAIILVAGAAMNFLSGLLILVCIFGFAQGEDYDYIPQPVIGSFYAGNAIEGENGLQVGDRFYEIDGERVYTSSNVSMLLNLSLSGDPSVHDIVVIRDGKKVVLSNFYMEKRELQTEQGLQVLYGLQMKEEPRSLGNTLSYSWNNAKDYVRMVWLSFRLLFTGRAGVQDVGGPVLIVKTITDVGTQSDTVVDGIINVSRFAAFIAINLAVMNLLPIPALDGGRLFGVVIVAAIEKVSKKKVNPKIEGYIHAVGMVILLAIMALVAFKDVFSLFK